MEQCRTASTTSGGIMHTANGHTQHLVQGQPQMVGQRVMVYVPAMPATQQIQLMQPGQFQLQGAQTLQLHGQQGHHPQHINTQQQPQTVITAGQNQSPQTSMHGGQHVAQMANAHIVYQPAKVDGTALQQGMITNLASDQIVQVSGSNTNSTSSGQDTMSVTLPVSGNMGNTGGMDDEPLYVNPKQYDRILKRRLARSKLQADGRVPKGRKRYLHESRHRHAMQRTRVDGGRFFSPKEEEDDGFSPETATAGGSPSR